MPRAFCAATLLALALLVTACRSGTPQQSTPPASAPMPVPWTAEAAPPFVVPTPLPTSTPDLEGPTCSASDMELVSGGGNGAGGRTIAHIRVINRSQGPCVLSGLPVVRATIGGREVLAEPDTFFPTLGVPGKVAPGEAGSFGVTGSRDCPARFADRDGRAVVDSVVVEFGGGTNVFRGPMDVLCGLGVLPLAVRPPDPVYPPDPFAALRIELLLPPAVRRGDTLHYRVRVTNPTESEIRLDPCPGYIQAIGDLKDQRLLNCAASPTIPAHASVEFAVEIPVSADLRPGPARLLWALRSIASEPVPASIEVTD